MYTSAFGFSVHAPNNWVHGASVTAIVVQVLEACDY